METKKTILSEKEYNLIEDIIAKYGLIVDFEQIYDILKGQISRQSVRNLVNKLSKHGWFVRIKKGVYAISGFESRGFITTPLFKIAQILNSNSYVSFESALQQYGMFDQMLRKIISISINSYKTKNIQGINYKYIKTKKSLFFGWEEQRVGDYIVKIAFPEKAILDMLNFKRNIFDIDLILEKIGDYKNDLNIDRLNEFSVKYSKTVQRVLGFLFDKLLIDSSDIYRNIKNDKSCSYMTNDSKGFNSKWRLYVHEHFEDKK